MSLNDQNEESHKYKIFNFNEIGFMKQLTSYSRK